MNWVIMDKTSGKYVVSGRLTVFDPRFAHRFRTSKQAKAYIISSCGSADSLAAVELPPESFSGHSENK